MTARAATHLALSITDRTWTFAVVSGGHGDPVVRQSARLPAPDESAAPAVVGGELARVLRSRRMPGGRVVVGVPAKWLMAVEKELPPSDASQARSILRLQAERLPAGEGGELALDYVGEPHPSASARVLLVGMLKKRLERLQAILSAAGLTPVAVTSTALTVAQSTLPETGDATLVLVNRGGAEVVWRHGGRPSMLRHVAMAGAGAPGSATAASTPAAAGSMPGDTSLAALGAELARVAALTPRNGEVTDAEVVLWDGAAMRPQAIDGLAERLSMRVTPERQFSGLADRCAAENRGDSDPADGGDGLAAAIALGAAAANHRLPIDFLHSRLQEPRKRRITRPMAWTLALTLTAIVALGAMYWSVEQRQAEVNDLERSVAAHQGDIKTAEATLARFKYSRGFFDRRPPVLECMRDMAACFGESDRVWLTSLTLRETRAGQVIGKAANQKTVLDLMDRLKKTGSFLDVKLIDLRESGGGTRDVQFSLSFVYIARE